MRLIFPRYVRWRMEQRRITEAEVYACVQRGQAQSSHSRRVLYKLDGLKVVVDGDGKTVVTVFRRRREYRPRRKF